MTKRSKLLHWPGSHKFKTACGREIVPDRIASSQSKTTCGSCLLVLRNDVPRRKKKPSLARGLDTLLEVVNPPKTPKPLHEWISPSVKPNVIEMLREMFFAEDAYGTGFYSDERWLKAYRALAAYAGLDDGNGARKWSPLWPTPPSQPDEAGHLSAERYCEVIRDLKEVLEDKSRTIRQLDIAMHGEKYAARQASGVDLIEPAKRLRRVAQLASELCDAIDAAEEDVGGCRPVKEILADLGPAVDAARPIDRG